MALATPSTVDTYLDLDASLLADAIRRREISAEEIIQGCIARAQRLDQQYNIFTFRRFAKAMDEAREIDAQLADGVPVGPLAGVPITVKDHVPTAGDPLTMGSFAFGDPIPPADIAVIARLRAAGAIIVGRTTLSEFGHKVLTDSPRFGVTRNPWAPQRSPGGSSGGAAVAIACGVGSIAVGTDGGGSIRCPAACTGTLGIKATLGRLPADHVADGFANFAGVGPITRRTADLKLAIHIMSGEVDSDPYSLSSPVFEECPTTRQENLRIGYLSKVGSYNAQPAVKASVENLLARLQGLGASVEAIEIELLSESFSRYVVLATTAHATRFGHLLDHAGAKLDPSMVACIEQGLRYSATDWQRASDGRTELFRELQRVLKRFDVLAMPTTMAPPPALDAGGAINSAFFAEWAAPLYPFNLTGHPALSIPCGMIDGVLPIGMQLVGRWFREDVLISLAAAVELVSPWVAVAPSRAA
jgi:aspartyl-tRNA(Asn)/glutamyl-tRNA(Gln) amidotransferase subunit A